MTLQEAEQDARIDRMVEAIVAKVEREHHVTLGEIHTSIEGFAFTDEVDGAYVYRLTADKVIWHDMSSNGVTALERLLAGKLVAIQRVSPLLYAHDGVSIPERGWEPISLVPKSKGNVEMRLALLALNEADLAYAKKHRPECVVQS